MPGKFRVLLLRNPAGCECVSVCVCVRWMLRPYLRCYRRRRKSATFIESYRFFLWSRLFIVSRYCSIVGFFFSFFFWGGGFRSPFFLFSPIRCGFFFYFISSSHSVAGVSRNDRALFFVRVFHGFFYFVSLSNRLIIYRRRRLA